MDERALGVGRGGRRRLIGQETRLGHAQPWGRATASGKGASILSLRVCVCGFFCRKPGVCAWS